MYRQTFQHMHAICSIYIKVDSLRAVMKLVCIAKRCVTITTKSKEEQQCVWGGCLGRVGGWQEIQCVQWISVVVVFTVKYSFPRLLPLIAVVLWQINVVMPQVVGQFPNTVLYALLFKNLSTLQKVPSTAKVQNLHILSKDLGRFGKTRKLDQYQQY